MLLGRLVGWVAEEVIRLGAKEVKLEKPVNLIKNVDKLPKGFRDKLI